MEKLRDKKSFILPILVGIGHFVWLYLLCSALYNNNLLIGIDSVTVDNIIIKFADDYLLMLLFPTIIIIFNRKNLNDFNLNCNSKRMVIILVVLLIVFFFLHNDYSVAGFYKFFFYLIVISFGEEFIYRGYIYNILKGKSVIKAIIISGTLWGIGHGILPSILENSNIFLEMLYNIGGGIIGGWYFIYIQEKSGTLWVPVLIHALLDYSYMRFGFLIAIIVLVYYIRLSKENKSKTIANYR
ncbi:CPBP family intramembrane glutamic endopeptidase [Sedimentibacter sp.]|uniref:CPBP family intramembrane glutamic endopeptidase n=1 Tax=Sedimentibacter sp. TaxID=1960295 RepID=UPI000ED13EE1|nr:CPBP family intramembrane glutamic endopeptidase [Sedimentibacter sp.]HCX62057.1 hypothetical protein [Clostridiales bacterium]